MDVLDTTENRYDGKSLESVLANGYSFNLGDYLNKAFRLFGNDAGSYIGFTLVSLVIGFVIGLIPYLGTLAGLFVNPALNGGWFIFGQKHNTGQQRSFSNFFDGFKNPPWLQLVIGSFISSLFVGIAVLLIILPAGAFIGMDYFMDLASLKNMRDPEEMTAILSGLFAGKILLVVLLAVLVGCLIAVLYLFMPLFIIFRGMSFWEAMEASRKVVSKNYIQVLLFLIVLGILLVVGAMICLVGLLVAVPIYFLAVYSAFEDIMGTGESHS